MRARLPDQKSELPCSGQGLEPWAPRPCRSSSCRPLSAGISLETGRFISWPISPEDSRSVRPEISTERPQPAGMVKPCSSSASYTSPKRAPAPTVATPAETDTECFGQMSMTIPSVEERPAKQCPPLLIAVLSPHVVEPRDSRPTRLLVVGRAGEDDFAR